MIRLWLLLLGALALGAAVAFYLRADSGYVLLRYGAWIVETSVLGLAAALLAGAALLVTTLRLLWMGWRLPATVQAALERRKRQRARESFESGLRQLLEGHWKRAEIELVRRAADHHAAHLNYLAAARAAQRVGAPARRDHYLTLAARSAPENELATLLTQAELQLERSEHEKVVETASQIRSRDPEHSYAIELLARGLAALSRWEPLCRLLEQTRRHPGLDAALRVALWRQALEARMATAVVEARLDALKQIWSEVPELLREDETLVRRYVAGLVRLNAHAEASALIVQVLKRRWDGELVWRFGELHASDPLGQLASIEQWLTLYGEKPELLVTAGRACLANKLWGKARSYLEAVTRVQPSAAAFLELARLSEQTQNSEEAARWYRQGLEHAARSGEALPR
ncbi:MAG TPA: heme biosynthesis HemY N-terminal domain-containing protein [Nevskiaceae bacterium]|nr:heme biosynthesis HemY N-terminal domain-containing protein [Nevskiaceae bacterium]